MSDGSSRNLPRARSAVSCRASEESRLKNWVNSLVSPNSLIPFCTRGVNPEVSTSVDVGRFDDPDSSMFFC